MILLASNHVLAADIIEVVGESHGGAEIRHEILQINHPAFPIVVRPSGVAAVPGRPLLAMLGPARVTGADQQTIFSHNFTIIMLHNNAAAAS